MNQATIMAARPELAPASNETTIHDFKAAIESRNVSRVFGCLGLSEYAPRHLLIAALQDLQCNEKMSREKRKHILSSSLLFHRIDEAKRAGCASLLIDMQDMAYLQRLIDLLDN